jgi:ribonucleoside-diphosphate reductase beta chain
MNSVFPTEQSDYTKNYMFFGTSPNVNRNDVMRFPKFDSFTQQQLGFFWRPEEIDCSKDRQDFNKMEKHEQHIFISNIKYQSLLDSVQGRAPSLAFLPLASLPEVETWITTWAFSETIHSRSYTHIIKNVMNDPSEVFDTILDVPEIMERAALVTKAYDDLLSIQGNGIDKKIALAKAMINVYALESIRFYASFVSTFAFAKRGVMEGQGKIMQLIARDEFLHQGGTHYKISRWMLGLDDPDMENIMYDLITSGYVKDTMRLVCEQEMAWSDYLFQYGSLIGLNGNILKEYLMWLTDTRTKSLLVLHTGAGLKDFGYRKIYDVKENPIPWISEFLESDNTQVAPQEAEISTYLVGQIDMQVDDDFLSDLSI